MALHDIENQALQLPIDERRRLAQLLLDSIRAETSQFDSAAVTALTNLSPWLRSLVGVIAVADEDDYVTYLQDKYK